MNNKQDNHLDIFVDHYMLYTDGNVERYDQGQQSEACRKRYEIIDSALDNGFLEELISNVRNFEYNGLSEGHKKIISELIEKKTSEVGRGLIGLAFLQLVIKTIEPNQSIRLHKGSSRKGSFSWVEGISMRTLDSNYIEPFLRKYDLLKVNKDGVFMTRSLAENYPYTRLYKAELRGLFREWIEIVEALESNRMPARGALEYMIMRLMQSTQKSKELARKLLAVADQWVSDSFDDYYEVLKIFFTETTYNARAFEVVIHAFVQAMIEIGVLRDVNLVPLSQMRSANKKHGNIGDIELCHRSVVFESWDAKFGKPYLRDELEELRDKLIEHEGIQTAGFIVNNGVIRNKEIITRVNEIEIELDVKLYIMTFEEWIKERISGLCDEVRLRLGRHWLVASAETFALQRMQIAPIDEPCDEWVRDLTYSLETYLNRKF